jgi:chromosome segregation ATPase
VAQLREQVAQAGDVAALKASLAEQRAIVAKLQEQTQGGDQIAALHAQLEEQRASSQRLLIEHREQQRRDQDELVHLRAVAAEAPSAGAANSAALTRELEQLRSELVESETQCEKYAELLQKARKQYDAEFERLAEVDALTVRLEAAESEKRRLEQLLRDADATSTASATRHLARVDELRAELNQREAALETATDELEQLRQTCAAASDLARDRKQEADARRDEAYALNEKLSGASQTNDELTRRFLQTQNLCAEQENQLNDMRGQAGDGGGDAARRGGRRQRQGAQERRQGARVLEGVV